MPFRLNRSKWAILAKTWPKMTKNAQFCTCWPFYPNLFSNFFSNLIHSLLMNMSFSMRNGVLIESLEVGHFGPKLGQNWWKTCIFGIHQPFSQNLFSNFFSNLTHRLHMTKPFSMHKTVLVEWFKMGHFGENLAKKWRKMQFLLVSHFLQICSGTFYLIRHLDWKIGMSYGFVFFSPHFNSPLSKAHCLASFKFLTHYITQGIECHWPPSHPTMQTVT